MARTDPQFNVRMPADLKEKIEEAAKENGGTDNIGVVLIEPFADEVSVL